MGAVYRAHDRHLGVAVAIKENCVPEMRAAFRREAEFLANLRHPSLPVCIDFLEVNGGQFLVMEFIEGDDLATAMIKAREPLPNATVEELAWQLLQVIQYLHQEGVQHRDIKSRNIKFINGRVYLLDFGIAYGASGEMATIGVGEDKGKYGSKRYSPPEQLKGGSVGPSGDLYSAGATLYYAMTNVQPVDAEERLESLASGGKDPLEDVRIYNRSADERMSRAVMLALALRPEDRPQSAAELHELMFPQAYALPKAAGMSRFLTLRLLSEAFVLGVFACILIFVLRQPRTPDAPPALVLEKRREVPVPTPTPTPEYTPTPAATPTPDRTPAPAEEVAKSSRAEQAARLAGEAARDRQSGKVKSALSKLMRALSLDEKNPSVHYQLGDILWEEIIGSGKQAGRMPEVLEKAKLVLDLTRSPRSKTEYVARAWANVVMACRAALCSDRAFLDQAIADAKVVLTKYDPDSPDALTILASATYAKGGPRMDEQTARRVLEYYGRVVKLTPLNAQSHANLAEVNLSLADHAKGSSRAKHLELARQGFGEATRLAQRADFYTDLGDVYFKLGNFRKAGEVFRAAIQADSTYYRAYIRLAAAYNKLGQPGRAAEAREQARRLNPNDGGARQLPPRAPSDRTADGR
jgi:serine/threonine protein kinase/Flp pilus assembly protein TadD